MNDTNIKVLDAWFWKQVTDAGALWAIAACNPIARTCTRFASADTVEFLDSCGICEDGVV
jgi:hypothetical protein